MGLCGQGVASCTRTVYFIHSCKACKFIANGHLLNIVVNIRKNDWLAYRTSSFPGLRRRRLRLCWTQMGGSVRTTSSRFCGRTVLLQLHGVTVVSLNTPSPLTDQRPASQVHGLGFRVLCRIHITKLIIGCHEFVVRSNH